LVVHSTRRAGSSLVLGDTTNDKEAAIHEWSLLSSVNVRSRFTLFALWHFSSWNHYSHSVRCWLTLLLVCPELPEMISSHKRVPPDKFKFWHIASRHTASSRLTEAAHPRNEQNSVWANKQFPLFSNAICLLMTYYPYYPYYPFTCIIACVTSVTGPSCH
jgi:hypothetical protein